MEITGTSTGASTYALKKAMHMLETLLNLLDRPPASQDRMQTTSEQLPDNFNAMGKGGIIDIVV